MPLYIPWLTETIKKRGVRYLLHHYLGQFFLEKLTLEQLSIDIYQGKGSIMDLRLDVDGLNDELDFIPFKFLEGCSIGQISVEVPWSSLSTDACRVELDEAKFVCRLKTSADSNKAHCTESTLLTRSLMTSSMQMAEDIVTTEDDDDYRSPLAFVQRESEQPYQQLPQDMHNNLKHPSMDQRSNLASDSINKKDANQMFEGLEMFAQLIDSVLRRTKLTARNTLFQIQPHKSEDRNNDHDRQSTNNANNISSTHSDCFKSTVSGVDDEEDDDDHHHDEEHFREGDTENMGTSSSSSESEGTVEFFIKFFRCEEIIDPSKEDLEADKCEPISSHDDPQNEPSKLTNETITKLLTLEDVEMRIGGVPVSNLIGKHTIMIKFNGQKSEISIFSGSPLLAVIGHEQLKTFFNVFDSSDIQENDSSLSGEHNQQMMSAEDYAKIENQLLETASFRSNTTHLQKQQDNMRFDPASSSGGSHHQLSVNSGRRWVETSREASHRSTTSSHTGSQDHRLPDIGYSYHNFASSASSTTTARGIDPVDPDVDVSKESNDPTLDDIEAFACELKLPGIWLCILKDGESLPALIKPYADSINSFQAINKYIDDKIKVPHIRFLALKVAVNITSAGISIFSGDLDISEHLCDNSMMPTLQLLHNDLAEVLVDSPRYKASFQDGKDIQMELLTPTKLLLDPRMLDRIVYDYKLISLGQKSSSKTTILGEQVGRQHNIDKHNMATSSKTGQQSLNISIIGERIMAELLCPIPDLTPAAHLKQTNLRPQSFHFDFRDTQLAWQQGILNVTCSALFASIKTQPQQNDEDAIRFIRSVCKTNERIKLTLEPSPSGLDTEFPSDDIEQALNESSMYDSIYVGQATESRICKEAFQTKRKVVGSNLQSKSEPGEDVNGCANERIITPGDRQHLSDYLKQTTTSTNLALSLHLPNCEVEFEDKEQLDLIYNRFGNDFVFWQPKAFGQQKSASASRRHSQPECAQNFHNLNDDDDDDDDDDDVLDQGADYEGRASEHSYHSLSGEGSSFDLFSNEVTCKITIDDLRVKFNHQSCAAALRQDISARDFLLGVVIDVNKKPNTIISLVADQLKLNTDSETVLDGNSYYHESSTFALTAEIQRPSRALKDIKLAIQLVNGLFNDFKTEVFKRFWQSISVTDEPILGYVAPKIVVELHIDLLSSALSLKRDGARPALLSIDELYLTSMVMEKTSQVMIRLVAEEISLYLKRNRKGLETMKNYICLVDSGLLDLDIRISEDGRLEFGVINNVITVRVCQDSLSALCKLFDVIVSKSTAASSRLDDQESVELASNKPLDQQQQQQQSMPTRNGTNSNLSSSSDSSSGSEWSSDSDVDHKGENMVVSTRAAHEKINLLEDAMNDFAAKTPSPEKERGGLSPVSSPEPITVRPLRDSVAPSYVSSSRSGSISSSEQDDGHYYSSSQSGLANDGDEEDDDDDDDDDESSQESSESEATSNSGNSSSCSKAASSQDDYYSRGKSDSLPPLMQQTTGAQNSSTMRCDSQQQKKRNSHTCLLDESNPLLGDYLTQPLLPASSNTDSPDCDDLGGRIGQLVMPAEDDQQQHDPLYESLSSTNKPIDESGFFVIGDDDVGAGIMDRGQQEPVVRKLIDGPINIIDNHFKMTKPRTIPEVLVHSVERYVLEEMTLVVNLFGGRDFDDDDASTSNAASQSSGNATKASTETASQRDSVSQLSLATDNEQAGEQSCFGPRTGSLGSAKLRSGNASMSSNVSTGIRKHSVSESLANAPPYKQTGQAEGIRARTSSLKRREGSSPMYTRRKHLSESGQDVYGLANSGTANANEQPRVRFGDSNNSPANLWESLDLMSSPDFMAAARRSNRSALSADSKRAGGTWRQNDVCIQLTLAKIKLLYELADPEKALSMTGGGGGTTTSAAATSGLANATEQSAGISWRFMLFIQDIEIKDRIYASDINKMLYEYCTESMPKRNTQLLAVKNIATINPSDGCEECDLKVSLKPLRLNIDQDTLVFLIDFFTTFAKSFPESVRQQQQQQQPANLSTTTVAPQSSVNRKTVSQPSDDGMKLRQDRPENKSRQPQRRRSSQRGSRRGQAHRTKKATSVARRSSSNLNPAEANQSYDTASTSGGDAKSRNANTAPPPPPLNKTTVTTTKLKKNQDEPLPTHCHSDNLTSSQKQQQPIYIKSFIFSPDVPIRLDYHAKHLDFEQGALAGILMGLAHLDCSELVLKRVQAKHGMRGLDRVLVFVLNSWLTDIKRNQLPSILGGVGPMHSVVQLFQGVRDLIWLPIDHYRRDRRLVRGIQRGASSFSSSTAMAAINLMNRFISIVQCTAQIAHDIVTPPMSGHHHRPERRLGPLTCVAAHQDGLTLATGGGGASGGVGGGASGTGTTSHRRHAPGSITIGPGFISGAHPTGAPSSISTLNQPRNFCEGVAVGFSILREGFNDTARNVAIGMQADDMRSAVGELVRQIPSTLLNPIISATEGAQNVLVGIRNQIAPDARREDQEKWKRRVRGK